MRAGFVLTVVGIVSTHLFAIPSDTLSSVQVVPGVIHTRYLLAGPMTVNVLQVTLTNPALALESYRPSAGLTTTTVQSSANDHPGHNVIAAVNGGFFSFDTGWPIDNQISDGLPVLGTSVVRSCIALTEAKRIFLDRASFSGIVIAKDGSSLTINECNTARSSGKTILYNTYRGSTTGTDTSGVEVIVQVLPAGLATNDTFRVVVQERTNGNSPIPSNGFVLSGTSGAGATFLTSKLGLQDTVKIFLGFVPAIGPSTKGLTELVSGHGHLIKYGVAYPTLGDYDQTGSGFNDIRNPRTFVGTNSDSTYLYLCTVDGRQPSSVGMTFTEMASFMQSIGATNALNLDGGGSTTMVVNGTIVNSPSDAAGERAVANSLQIVSTALSAVVEERTNPSTVFLAQNFPNPFNPVTEIRFTLAFEADVSIKVFNLLGQEQATLMQEHKRAGSYRVGFEGGGLSSGVYLYQLRTGTVVESKRMVLLK